MTEAMISLTDVTKRFGSSERAAVSELSLDIAEGDTVVLVGPSGCGKTTTMKMINRLVEPTSGTITVGGTDIAAQDPVELRRGIGYVIQSIGLLPHRTVRDNIAMVPHLLDWAPDRIATRTRELMEMFELDPDLAGRYPSELSGGQRQRVGVARALAADPPVMLMDEPFGAVDPIVRERLQEQFLSIQQTLRKTIVFVTHDVDEAIKMADKIAILNRGGILEQYATPEEILRAPANDFVESFVGAERGLKRLSLLIVQNIEIDPGPTVTVDSSGVAAKEAMVASGTDWVSILSDGRLLGWVGRDDLEDRVRLSDISPRPFSAHVGPQTSLRQVLDSIVTSQTNVAVVVGPDQSYEGIITLERLTGEITAR